MDPHHEWNAVTCPNLPCVQGGQATIRVAAGDSKSSKLDQDFELSTETFFFLLLRRFN